MKLLPVLLLTVGCVLILGGCAGRLRDPASRIRQQGGAAGELYNREIKLVLSDYGRRLIGMHNQNWQDMILHSQEIMPEIEWLCHFGPLLGLDTETEDGAEIIVADSRRARAAMVNYITEKIYPVRMSLDVMRGGRRFLLGEYIDSYVRNLELRRSSGSFELMYKRDF